MSCKGLGTCQVPLALLGSLLARFSHASSNESITTMLSWRFFQVCPDVSCVMTYSRNVFRLGKGQKTCLAFSTPRRPCGATTPCLLFRQHDRSPDDRFSFDISNQGGEMKRWCICRFLGGPPINNVLSRCVSCPHLSNIDETRVSVALRTH